MEEKVLEAKNKLKELIEKGQKIREKEILDYCERELPNTNKKERKVRHRVIQRIIKERRRNHHFHYVIKYIGKGEKGSL